MSEPAEFLTYGSARDALAEKGIREWEFRKLIDAKVIKGDPLRPGGRTYYRWSQIKRDVLAETKQLPIPTNGTQTNQREKRK